MKIGELASAAKCTTETIRFYEKQGLLPEAGRTSGNYRSYGPTHLGRLRLIRNCRALDMTHDEIRVLLAAIDASADRCGDVNAVLDEHIGHVDRRIEELLELKQVLSSIRQQCPTERSLDSCGILLGLAAMEAVDSGERRTHLG